MFEDGVAHGRQSRLRRWSVVCFVSTLLLFGGVLEKGVSDHRHERMTVKALRRSSLEVIEAEFVFCIRNSI